MTQLENICAAFRAKLRALLLQAGIARLIVVALAWLLPMAVLDWWIHLTTIWRVATLSIYIAALIATLYWTLLKPLARKWSDIEILRVLDRTASNSSGARGMLLDLFELQRNAGIQELDSPAGKALADSARESLESLAQQTKNRRHVRTKIRRPAIHCRWRIACRIWARRVFRQRVRLRRLRAFF